MATKKKAAKKAVKTKAAPPTSFDFLSRGNEVMGTLRDNLGSVLSRRKGRVLSCLPQSEIANGILPVSSIYMRWALDNFGVPRGVIDFVGADKLGKSSLAYQLVGHAARANVPCFVFACDGKPVAAPWAMRCYSSNAGEAAAISKAVYVSEVVNLDEMAEQLEEFCKLLRDPKNEGHIPKHYHVLVLVDNIGKLATENQAMGIGEYKEAKKKARGEVWEKAQVLDYARWMHQWVRRALVIKRDYNVSIMLSEHQNADDPMGSKGGGKVIRKAQWQKNLEHRTKSGGEGVNQIAGLQLVLSSHGWFYSGGSKIARRTAVKVFKNSYGASDRIFHFALKDSDFKDSPGFLDPCVRFDFAEVEWLAELGMLGMKAVGDSFSDPRYSCRELGFTSLSLEDAAQAWRETGDTYHGEIGERMLIPGHVDVLARMMRTEEREGEAEQAEVKEA